MIFTEKRLELIKMRMPAIITGSIPKRCCSCDTHSQWSLWKIPSLQLRNCLF